MPKLIIETDNLFKIFVKDKAFYDFCKENNVTEITAKIYYVERPRDDRNYVVFTHDNHVITDEQIVFTREDAKFSVKVLRHVVMLQLLEETSTEQITCKIINGLAYYKALKEEVAQRFLEKFKKVPFVVARCDYRSRGICALDLEIPDDELKEALKSVVSLNSYIVVIEYAETVPGGQEETPSTQETPSDLQYVEISQIEIPSWAREIPRDYLKESVEARDVIVPIVLADVNGRLILVDGRGRLELAKAKGLSKVPARIIKVDSEEEAILMAIELEKTKKEWANSYMLKLIKHLLSKGYSKTKIAEMLKISRSVLYRYLYAHEILENIDDDEIKQKFLKELDESMPMKLFEEVNAACNKVGITLADFARMLVVLYKESQPSFVEGAISYLVDCLNDLAEDKWVPGIIKEIAEKLNIEPILDRIYKESEEETEKIRERVRELREEFEKQIEEAVGETPAPPPTPEQQTVPGGQPQEEIQEITVTIPEGAPTPSETTEKPKPLDVYTWIGNLVDGVLEHIHETLEEIDETEHKIKFLIRLKEEIEILINELSVSG